MFYCRVWAQTLPLRLPLKESMKHLTKRNYGHHIDKGCGISIPESGYRHGFPEPQRNVWKSRKWTAEQAEAVQKAEDWLRQVARSMSRVNELPRSDKWAARSCFSTSRDFSGCSEPFAVQDFSIQAVRSPSEFALSNQLWQPRNLYAAGQRWPLTPPPYAVPR